MISDSSKTIKTAKEALGNGPYQIHYALKANSNRRILNEILKFGLGADCVSGNEVNRAIEEGFDTKKFYSLVWVRQIKKLI